MAVRSVPRTRIFDARSFGLGAAADITTTARPFREVKAQAEPTTYHEPDDRIREEFRGLIRDLDLCVLYDNEGVFAPPALNVACSPRGHDFSARQSLLSR